MVNRRMNQSSLVSRVIRPASRGVAAIVLGACMLLGPGATGASAQPANQRAVLEPPTVTGKSEEGQGWGIFGMFLIFLLLLGAAMVPTKRGHQD
ncbi:MAG: hypothetical protein MUE97_00680 [Phycisphaerales bacterium]|nr:hypothetical protein [Phycisphaerales bacterium]